MRIKNKYLRNRAFRIKYWKRIRNKSHPFETHCPSSFWHYCKWGAEEQIKKNFEWITIEARKLESGDTANCYHAPKWFRKQINNQRKAKIRNVMFKVRNGDYELEIPKFKNDADWLYF